MNPMRKPLVAAAFLCTVLGLPGLAASAPAIVQAAAALSPVAGSPGAPSSEQLATPSVRCSSRLKNAGAGT